MTTAAYEMSDPRHTALRLASWRELARLQRRGLVRAIGLSNFSPRLIEPLLQIATPAVVQVEMHPLLQQVELRAYCEVRGILLQAYGQHRSGAQLGAAGGPLTGVARALAAEYRVAERSAAGLLSMRWALQAGAALMPRSTRFEHVASNAQVFSLPPLSADDMLAFASLNANTSLFGLHEAFVHDQVA